MRTVQETLGIIAQQIFRLSDRRAIPADEVDFHLLSVIALLCTRVDVLDATFPLDGKPSADALYRLGVDPTRVPPQSVDRLVGFRDGFASVQFAWAVLSGYENPPCPPNRVAEQLVKATLDLRP
jgi:hypothetical protein